MNLDNISKINIGDKLVRNGSYVSVDTSYVKSVTRWYYGVSRFTILEFIGKILDDAYINLKTLRQKTDDTSGILWIKLISRLKNSAVGLARLRQTYSSDEEFTKQIDIIIKKLLKYT